MHIVTRLMIPPVCQTENKEQNKSETETPLVKRKYNGPPKGSDEAKARMERVRAAQWAKNGLVIGQYRM